jgi:hypothetical protein
MSISDATALIVRGSNMSESFAVTEEPRALLHKSRTRSDDLSATRKRRRHRVSRKSSEREKPLELASCAEGRQSGTGFFNPELARRFMMIIILVRGLGLLWKKLNEN